MLINEVCKKSNVTKKAIEYYAEHGLISPVIAENGYRQFSDDDVEKLKKISIMRGLGIPSEMIHYLSICKSFSQCYGSYLPAPLFIGNMRKKHPITLAQIILSLPQPVHAAYAVAQE